MGTLHYGSPPASFQIDDRALAHVELVVMAKLRRRENLSFSLVDDKTSVRQAMWISPVTTLRFEYDGPMPEINRLWLQDLVDTANSSSGLRLVPEPELPSR
ncbi:hypothetical protein Q9R08_14710 [Microbacterium sp. QXD-8]|uniref:DUF7882 domain-containing protein n=1 Tax=Microbacterium psychrotolerans TaxID=3068321 RepID=A0ABU0Z3S0_9MICO|nr:hypothetical protein [Microbacterium sp. QXD-8]MDQ7879238.1 hypothetical protein [Microbacterium sp. QXD-8]